MKTQAYAGSQYAQRDTALPTLSGSAPGEIGKADSIAQISVAGEYYEVPVDPLTGKYTWTATVPFNDGDYSVSVTVKDRAGNVGKPTLYTLRVDTTPPDAPVLLNLYDDQGAKTGSFDAGKTTDDKRPKLTGVAQKGTTVYLQDESGKTIGSALADKVTGVWKMEPNEDLKDGANNLTLVAEETFAGKTRTGTPSDSFTIVIGADTPVLPPNTITIKEAIDDVGAYTGKLASGALTDDTTPTLRGDVSAGSTVIVYYRLSGSNTWAGSATATVTGESWSWTPASALPTGNYEFQASIGANSSALFSLEIATAEQIGLRTRIESAYDDFGQDQGPLADGAITDDATPSLRGRAEANSNVIIRYMLEGGSTASVVVNADSAGNWRWTPAAELQTGTWTFDVQTQGRSSWSNAFKLEITGSGENGYAPIISHAIDDFGPSTGERKSGASTDDTTPTLHGKAAANSVVYLQAINGAEVETFSVIADSSSNWEWTPAAELALGDWSFQASKTAGSGWGTEFELKISNESAYKPFPGLVDFETLPDGLVLGTIRSGITYSFTGGGVLTASSPEDSVKLVKNPLNNESSFGENSIWMADSTKHNNEVTISFAKRIDSYNKSYFASDFSMQIYNPSSKSITLKLSLASRIIAGEVPVTEIITYTLKPGLNTLFRSDFNAKTLTEEIPITYLRFIGSDSPEGIYLDNFSWKSESYDTNQNLYVYDTNDSTDQIEVMDELVKSTNEDDRNITDTLIAMGKDQLIVLSEVNTEINSIDISGTGDNTLKIDLNALLQHGEKDLFIEDGKTQLMVKGNEGDMVQLKDILPQDSDISEWQHQYGTVTVAGVEYDVYSHGDEAELLVQQGVKTELI